MSAAAFHPVQAFLQRLALLVDGIGECITGRQSWERLEQPLYVSALLHLQRLFARVHRGLLAAERRAARPKPVPPAPGTAKTGTRRKRPLPPGEVKLPRGFGWLIRLAPGVQIYGAGLADLLEDPDLPALLANAPQARQSLRAMCIMLGATVPEFLRPARSAKPGETAAAAAPPDAAQAPPGAWPAGAEAGPHDGASPPPGSGRPPDTPARSIDLRCMMR